MQTFGRGMASGVQEISKVTSREESTFQNCTASYSIASIERRFYRSLANLFEHYLSAVDRTVCFSNESEKQEIIFLRQGGNLKVLRKDLFDAMKEMASRGG